MKLKNNKYNTRELVRTFFFFFIIIVSVFFCYDLPRISLPLLAAYIISIVVEPAIPFLNRFGIRKYYSIGIIYAVLIFFITFPLLKLVPHLGEEMQNVVTSFPKIESYLDQKYSYYIGLLNDTFGLDVSKKGVRDFIAVNSTVTTKIVTDIPKYFASVIEWMFLVPFFLFFLLRGFEGKRAFLLKFSPNFLYEKVYQISYNFNKQMGRYIIAKIIEATILGLIITVGLLLMGVEFSLLLGIWAGITNIIPYVGPIFGAIPAFIFVIAKYGVGSITYGVFILYFVANAIDLFLVFPVLVSRIVNLHPLAVVTSVIVGSHFLGVIGMLVSIPVLAALKLVWKEFYSEFYSDENSFQQIEN